MKLRTYIGALVAVVALPGMAAAQTLLDTVGFLNAFVNSLIPLAISLALLMFFWGLIKYLFKIGGDDAQKEGIRTMIWGVAALFVMVSIWGIINILRSTFRVENNQVPPVSVPQYQPPRGR